MKRVSANRFVCFFILAASGLSWDLYSKHEVFEDLGYPAHTSSWVREFFGGWLTFRLQTSFNEGALWGIGQGYTWVFAALSVVAIVGVLYWLFVVGTARSLWLTISLALIMAGTLGNLFDRLGLHNCIDPVDGSQIHAVRDFLLFTFGGWPWPIFNFADVFLVTGAIMLVLHSFSSDRPAESAASPKSPSESKVDAETEPKTTTVRYSAFGFEDAARWFTRSSSSL